MKSYSRLHVRIEEDARDRRCGQWMARNQPLESAARELETLNILAAGQDERFMVCHGVHWMRINEGHQVLGEIDFVVIGHPYYWAPFIFMGNWK